MRGDIRIESSTASEACDKARNRVHTIQTRTQDQQQQERGAEALIAGLYRTLAMESIAEQAESASP